MVMSEATPLPFVQIALLGSVSSCCAESITYPLDTTKVRLQAQKSYQKIRYVTVGQTMQKIYRKEGIRAFYSGVNSALVRQVCYGGLRFGIYHQLKNKFGNGGNGNNLVLAALAGFVSAGVCCPSDLIKIRLQSDFGRVNGNPRYRNVRHAISKVYRKHGVFGFWRGIFPTSVRASVIAASDLATYDALKGLLCTYFQSNPDDFSTHFLASIVTGWVTCAVSTPFDVVKTRYMNQRFSRAGFGRSYRNPFHCAQKIVRKEGFFALYKGFIPIYLRVGPHVLVTFMLMEQLMSTFNSTKDV